MKRTVHWDHHGPRIMVQGKILRRPTDCPPGSPEVKIGDKVEVTLAGMVTLGTGEIEFWDLDENC